MAAVARYDCPVLSGTVELTHERLTHLCEEHPEFAPFALAQLALVLAEPRHMKEESRESGVVHLARWMPDLLGGKFFRVVIKRDPGGRLWILTAFPARRLPGGFRSLGA